MRLTGTAAIAAIIEAYNDALTTHIYDEQNGETIPNEEHALVADARLALIGLEKSLRALVSDVQAMRCGIPEHGEMFSAAQEGGLFGPFEDNEIHPHDGSAVISWPNLGISLAEAQAVLGTEWRDAPVPPAESPLKEEQ